MSKLLKVLLPVLIDFGVFWLVVTINLSVHPMKLAEIGNGNLYSLMAYFHLFWLLLLLDGILTQYLVIVPLWDSGITRGHTAQLITLLWIILVSVIFAGSISYIIWDPAEGRGPLFSFCWYLTEIQLFYWLLNFVILYLIDRDRFVKLPEPVKGDA